jgi:hypothetical protein
MADHLAGEFMEFESSGRVFDRAAVIDATSGQAPFQFRIEAFTARALAAEVALTTYRLSVWSESETKARVTLRSSVWVHRAGRWQMIFHQGTVTSGAVSEGAHHVDNCRVRRE